MQAYSKLETQDKPLYNSPTQYTMKNRNNFVYCRCGHTLEFWHGETKILCNWCGTFVFKNKKEEFKSKMKERLKK